MEALAKALISNTSTEAPAGLASGEVEAGPFGALLATFNQAVASPSTSLVLESEVEVDGATVTPLTEVETSTARPVASANVRRAAQAGFTVLPLTASTPGATSADPAPAPRPPLTASEPLPTPAASLGAPTPTSTVTASPPAPTAAAPAQAPSPASQAPIGATEPTGPTIAPPTPSFPTPAPTPTPTGSAPTPTTPGPGATIPAPTPTIPAPAPTQAPARAIPAPAPTPAPAIAAAAQTLPTPTRTAAPTTHDPRVAAPAITTAAPTPAPATPAPTSRPAEAPPLAPVTTPPTSQGGGVPLPTLFPPSWANPSPHTLPPTLAVEARVVHSPLAERVDVTALTAEPTPRVPTAPSTAAAPTGAPPTLATPTLPSQVERPAPTLGDAVSAVAPLPEPTQAVATRPVSSGPQATLRPEALAQDLNAVIATGAKEARIQLRPRELGHVDVKLTFEPGQVEVVITARNDAGRQALAQELPALIEALRQADVPAVVRLTDPEASGGTNEHGDSGQDARAALSEGGRGGDGRRAPTHASTASVDDDAPTHDPQPSDPAQGLDLLA